MAFGSIKNVGICLYPIISETNLINFDFPTCFNINSDNIYDIYVSNKEDFILALDSSGITVIELGIFPTIKKINRTFLSGSSKYFAIS